MAFSKSRRLGDLVTNTDGDLTSAADVDITGGTLQLASGSNRRLFYRPANADVLLEADSGLFYRQDIDNNHHSWFVGNSERMRIETSGDVGIGTTSPGERLEVGGNIFVNTSGNPNLTVKTTGAGNNPFVRIQADTNYWDLQTLFSNADDELDFRYNGSSKLIIDKDGNVGIGTTSPDENLTIASAAPTIKFVDSDGTEQNTIVKQSGGNFFILARDNTANAGIAFYGNGGGTSSEYARFTTSGNLKFPSGQGIDFSPTANSSASGASTTSELFDDYEEGTWTPTVNIGTVTTVANSSEYTKIGDMVFAQTRINGFSNTTDGNYFVLGGLPYSVGTTESHIGTAWGNFSQEIMFFYVSGNAYFSGVGYSAVRHADLSSGQNVIISLIYRHG